MIIEFHVFLKLFSHLVSIITDRVLVEFIISIHVQIVELVLLSDNLLEVHHSQELVFFLNVFLKQSEKLLPARNGVCDLLKQHICLKNEEVCLGLVLLPVGGIVSIVLRKVDSLTKGLQSLEVISNYLVLIPTVLVMEGLMLVLRRMVLLLPLLNDEVPNFTSLLAVAIRL